jgi:hypothetical protein
MRLDFNVLWVDDQPQQLESQFAAIAKGMQEQGFDFHPTVCSALDKVRSKINDDVFKDEVDLILVDWDLGGGLKGQNVIAEIREAILYKDVIFYSSLTTTTELREHASAAGAEGVFCTSKNSVVDEVLGVFEALIKKVLDLDHTRGIVMGATSDIDQMVMTCLSAIDGLGNSVEKKELLNKAKELVGNSISNLEKKAKELEAATGVAAMLESHALFTANDRLRVLSTVLKSVKFDEHEPLRGGLKTYIQNVVPKRNELGHLVLIPSGKPSELTDPDGKVVTLEEMRELRRFLLRFRSDFRKLRDALSKPA